MTQDRNLPLLAKAGLLAVALAVGTVGASPLPALAFGGSSSSTKTTTQCKKGYAWDKSKKKCVKASAGLEDKDLYEQGRDLALAGRYQNALALLAAVKNRDSMTLTMIGYATRKLGRIDEGMGFYAKALALDPDNVNTHEYLGEAYAEKGQVDLAKAELVRVKSLCGTGCEQYRDLAEAIAATHVP